VLFNHSICTVSTLSTSDHHPVLLTIRGPLEADKTKANFLCHEANWTLFQKYLVSNLNTQCIDGNCSRSELHVPVKHLTDTLIGAARYAIPLRRRTFKSMQIATSTRTLIQKRKKLREQWQGTRDNTLHPLINSVKEQIDSAIKEQLSNTWQKTLQNLDTNNMKDTWRISKRLTNTNPNISPLIIKGKTAYTTPTRLYLTTPPPQLSFFSLCVSLYILNSGCFLNQN
jgi:hypothetical protein